MQTLAERLKFARQKANLSQQQIAERAGMSQPTYYKVESGKTLRTTYLNELANVLKVSPDWLATGKGEMVAASSDVNPNFRPIDDWELEFDEIAVPFYKEFAVACGHGIEGIAYDSEHRKLKISRSTIDRIRSHRDKVFATLADGDSMSPTINDGDTIWVDMSKKTIKDGKIFVFEYGNLFMCKRLYRLPNNGLRVVSDNSDIYPDWQITGQERENNGFCLIGWVWHWSVMERW